MELNGNAPSASATIESTSTSRIQSSTTKRTDQIPDEYDRPIFDIEQVQLQFGLNRSLKHLAVQSNKMFLLLDSLAYKIDLKNPSHVMRFQVPGVAPIKVTNCWLHPNGQHLFIQVNQFSYFYLHDSYKSFKIIPKFKGLDITHFAFPDSPDFETTGEFLFGTLDGSIYIASVKSHDPMTQENKRDDKYIKFVFKEPNEKKLIGLTFTENGTQINAFFGQSLYTWDCFDTSYAELLKVFKSNAPKIVHLPTFEKACFISNNKSYVYISHSDYELYSNDSEIQLSLAKTLKVNNETLSKSGKSLLLSPHHLIALNGSHDELLIFNKLTSQSSFTPMKLNLNTYINDNEKVLGAEFDINSHTYWIFTNNSIYEMVIQNEAISVWYSYYQMGKYDEALKCLNEDDAKSISANYFKKDIVLIKQGYSYLQQGGFGIDSSLSDSTHDDLEPGIHGELENTENLIELQIKGMRILAQSTEPFEKICLMLLNVQQHSKTTADIPTTSFPSNSVDSTSLLTIVSEKLLVEYLLIKFDISKTVEKNKVRITILSSWIVELMLRIIHSLEYAVNEQLTVKSTLTDFSGDATAKKASNLKEYKKGLLSRLNLQFHDYLKLNYKLLDRNTIYQIIGELHYPSKLIFYAELIQDYEFILKYYIDTSNWKEALNALVLIYTSFGVDSKKIVYANSTVLLVNSPKLTTETWLKMSNGIDYEKFLPAILTYNKNTSDIPLLENYSLHFLSKVIYDKGVRNKLINNYYLSLLITYPDNKNQATKQVIKFLNHMKLDNPNSSRKSQYYDTHFILRLCLTYRQYQPAVLILLNEMSLFDQALKLALDNELTDLGEFVLRKYDEFIENYGELKVAAFNSNSDNELSFRQVSEIYNEGDREQDISLVGKIKLEEESYASRKQLWVTYARYLIDRVCKGKSIEFLDEQGLSVIETRAPSQPVAEAEKRESLKNITSDIVGSMIKTEHPQFQENSSEKFNKVLKYILSLSNSGNNIGVLGLKDLLPLFPESVMINSFKEEIVKSLNQYNNKINQLSLEMKESLNVSSNLKNKIKESSKDSQRAKIHTIIQPGEPCQLCHTLLVSKNFIFFPNCHHGFHKDCLIRFYLKSKGNYRFKKIFQNFKKDPSVVNKKELDEILTKECSLCNESNIDSIDNYIIDLDTDRAELVEWVI